MGRSSCVSEKPEFPEANPYSNPGMSRQAPAMLLAHVYQRLACGPGFAVEVAPGADPIDATAFVHIVEACRALLRSKAAKAGDAVMFQGDQGLPALAVFWACVMEAMVFVPVDAGWPAYLLQKAVARAIPSLAVVDDECLPAWHAMAEAGAIPGVPVLPVSQLPVSRVAPSCVADAAEEALEPDTPAAFLFTSGSAGEPKAVVLSHAALARSARLVVDTFDWHPGERLLNLADPHTMSGLRNAFVSAPLAGMTWVCAPKKTRENAFALMECVGLAQAQRMVAAPILLRHVNLLGARVADDAFASLKALYCTGADLNADEVGRFHARFGIPVVNYYGLTETVGLCLSQDPGHWSPEDGSLGRPVGCRVRLVGEDGAEAGAGEVGELQVLLEHPMSGYLRDDAATAAAFEGPWLRTGDLVRQHADGRISIVGRSGGFIKTLGTEKVQPQEIEAVLQQCPGVEEAAVFGWTDPAGGERIAALIVAMVDAEPASLSDAVLASFVRERLGPARVPAMFRQVGGIPRSANGKILRTKLGNFI